MIVTYDAFAEWLKTNEDVQEVLEEIPQVERYFRECWQGGYDKAKAEELSRVGENKPRWATFPRKGE